MSLAGSCQRHSPSRLRRQRACLKWVLSALLDVARNIRKNRFHNFADFLNPVARHSGKLGLLPGGRSELGSGQQMLPVFSGMLGAFSKGTGKRPIGYGPPSDPTVLQKARPACCCVCWLPRAPWATEETALR